jgi:hypothetical protein
LGIRSFFASLFEPSKPPLQLKDALLGKLTFDGWGWYGDSTPFPATGVIGVMVTGDETGPSEAGRALFRWVVEHFSKLDQNARNQMAGYFDAYWLSGAKLKSIDLVQPENELSRDFVLTYVVRNHDWRVEFKKEEVLGYYPDG